MPKARKILITLGVLAVGASAPVAAQARDGGDDPAGHHRHGAHERLHHHQRAEDRARHGADDGVVHHRHGADDGPNHT
jgi:hypothetical protein